MPENGQMASSDSSWRVAYSFLLFLSNQVEAALEELKPAGGRHLNYMIEYIDYFADHEDWGKIQEIAPFFINHVKNHIEKMRLHERHQFVTMADTIFYQVSIHSKDASLHERLLLEMLPYSRSELKHLYFMTKQYAKLMEFLAITQMEPGRDILQLVQKEAPERLLPYYHQLVMEAIARKNRKSYKEAVRYLKKLRTIYKKLKRQDTWQQFFDLLMQETKRLRAFQEECQRGKLIHAETKTV